MRVIAGTAKGRKLHAPQGMTTRPTPSRVREALFSIIAGHISQARVLDLFAGTGALGIEALSRGAASAVFVEQDRKVADLLRRNLQSFASVSRVVTAPAQKAVATLGSSEAPFDLIFLDPPYAKGLIEPTLQRLIEHAMLAPGVLVVCEHHSKTPPPQGPEPLVLHQARVFGDVAITLFGMPQGAPSSPADAHKGKR